jgi:hypothetical protein
MERRILHVIRGRTARLPFCSGHRKVLTCFDAANLKSNVSLSSPASVMWISCSAEQIVPVNTPYYVKQVSKLAKECLMEDSQ